MPVSRRCLCCVKYLMFVFNLIFWLGGCGLFGVGVWLSFTQTEFSSLPLSFPSLSAANLLLVAGGITMITGFLGCLGALKEQRCLLFMFFVILLLLVLTEVTLTLVIHVFHDKLDSKAQGELKEGMKIYKSEPGLKQSWDNVQKMPCYQKARQWLLDNISSVLIFGVCIGVVQILALVFSMLMYCQILCAEKHLD
ncbi:tetraspanin-4 isoform X2 [Antennarius striatus]|uniref:tetraspanin-4 isoform X2 n=1 Tax=Antennarius striatus TaxID=241820 RepID=UPI0035B45977